MSAAGKPTAAQQELLFEQIATLANSITKEFYHRGHVQERETEDVELELERLRVAFCHVGWLADLGCGGDVRGGAEAWLLPPSYHIHAGEAKS